MTNSLDTFPLGRPASAAAPGTLDDHFYDLVEANVRAFLARHPDAATFVGIHTEDERLPSGTREAVEDDIRQARAQLVAVEAIDPAELSAEVRFERDLELHNLRLELFGLEEQRQWELRSTAMDGVGDPLFGLFAREFAPLAERLNSIAARLEAVPRFLAEHRSRAAGPQVRLWQQLELESAASMPSFFDEIVASGTILAEPEQRRLSRAAERAKVAVADYETFLKTTIETAVDSWPLGPERYAELVRLRAFDGLDAEQILEIGWQQLAEQHAARTAVARQIDPDSDEASVIDRLKSDHPATFEDALAAYREVMLRSRSYLIEHDIVGVPTDEQISVIATPEYLRSVMPFAAYFDAPKFDRDPVGLYIVTPSVDGDPGAMREHNWSSISNTSIHEAYPGHHLQLSVAGRHPSLTRLATQAPEFVEGWGMYSEQMMREEGFDDGPGFRLAMHTDAIWRACRIVLDVRMHRSEIGVDEAIAWLVEQTRFEKPNARAEVRRYTHTPTYQLSYLIGRVLLLQLRADERQRLGSAFSLGRFHDTLLRNGSLPISFHRRLLAGEGA
ncbi:MAG: DUF885 domain-containing protein [Candidatus Limnocylindrales bacterium]